jgi:hypothetical protein
MFSAMACRFHDGRGSATIEPIFNVLWDASIGMTAIIEAVWGGWRDLPVGD